MPNILYTLDFVPVGESGLVRFALMVRKLYEQLARIINGQINFGDGLLRDNIDGAWGVVPDTGPANTDFTVVHNLGRIPVGYWLMTTDVATNIYTGTVSWTSTEITLKSSAANAAINLFIV